MRKLHLLIIVIGLTCTLYSQQYRSSSRTISYTDAARGNRTVAVEIHYPATASSVNSPVAADSFPFIVFGHGFQMTASAYSPYYDSLSRLGYIVAFPTTESSLSPSHPNFAQDLIFVYQTLIAENSNSSSPFYQKIKAKGAIGGHSMGGGCTLLSASYSNPATCYFTMAAANTTPSSIHAAASMTKAYLAFAGSYDCIAPYATNQLPMYDTAGSLCKLLVEITGASHCQFGAGNFQCNFGEGVSGCASPPTSRTLQINTTLSYLIPYLEYYLKDRCPAWMVLDSVYSHDAVNTHKRSCTNTVPALPTISQMGDTLRSSAVGIAYEWYDNGQLVPNSNNVAIVATADGSYQVAVTAAMGCVALSAPYLYQHSGVALITDKGIVLYPNPVQDVLHIEVGEQIVSIQIVDAMGKIVIENGNNRQVDVSLLPTGIYAVVVHTTTGSGVSKIVVGGEE